MVTKCKRLPLNEKHKKDLTCTKRRDRLSSDHRWPFPIQFGYRLVWYSLAARDLHNNPCVQHLSVSKLVQNGSNYTVILQTITIDWKCNIPTCSRVISEALYKESILCFENVGAKAVSKFEFSQSYTCRR
jgi:hypothetical protein